MRFPPLPDSCLENDVACTCHLIPSLLNKPLLSAAWLDHEPASCVRHDCWRREGLALPPVEVVDSGWSGVLTFLRVRSFRLQQTNFRTAYHAQQKIRRRSPHTLRRSTTPCLSCQISQPLAPSSAAAACMRIICSRLRNSASARRSTRLNSRRCRSGAATTSVCGCCAAAARFLLLRIALPASSTTKATATLTAKLSPTSSSAASASSPGGI